MGTADKYKAGDAPGSISVAAISGKLKVLAAA